MSNIEIISKIKSWRDAANDYEDYFIKFALEYFVFNALLRITYFPNRDGVRSSFFDKDLINRLKQDSECENYILKNRKEWINEFKKELDRKPLKNLTRNKKLRFLRLESLEDWDNLVEGVYWIRNNLFHGYKFPGDERDQHLVKIGYHLLSGFNDYMLKKVQKGD